MANDQHGKNNKCPKCEKPAIKATIKMITKMNYLLDEDGFPYQAAKYSDMANYYQHFLSYECACGHSWDSGEEMILMKPGG